MEVSGQFHAPAALPQGKRPWYPSDTKLGGPQSRSGRGGEEKNSQPLPGFEPSIIRPVGGREKCIQAIGRKIRKERSVVEEHQ